ncbi:chromate transporter [Planococcus halotolerans]|uniref:Chromate transporter n=1 Tax=Planococcus halotolerans TaxID=2233542 RepID=A0A365L685_9BACL|nr:chromate transporter [Planococcus halotolerans]QHJ70352.1 chromate transporter [Planococcus halotolerans]RAZ80920.1 chromate transporter [Planococcus halotolerans]
MGKGKEGLFVNKNTDLFAAFFRIGMLGFGGGPSAIPLFEQEAVKKYKWMTSDEFGDTLALANTMPGPLATKMAGYIGYRVNGIMGCLVALLASVVPTVLLMIILLGVLQQYKDVAWVDGMSEAVVPVVGVMLAILTLDFLKKSRDSLGWLRAVIYTVISIILMEVAGVHPAVLIVAILVIVFLPFRKEGEPK